MTPAPGPAAGPPLSAPPHSPTPPRYQRQPLGLPAGSVRALLALAVLGLIWALLLSPDETIQVPLYLYYLMFLILGHFFAAHGHSIGGPNTGPSHPLYLPGGTLRILMIGGFIAVLAVRYHRHPDLEGLLKLQEKPTDYPLLPIILVGGFFLGIFVNRVVGRLFSGPQGPAPWFQDILSWVALLATVGLVVEVLIQVVINPTLEQDRRVNLPGFQAGLAAAVSFYFGVRS
jgi:hypothetical protein